MVEKRGVDRRQVVSVGLTAAGVAAAGLVVPMAAQAQGVRSRLSWQAFKNTPSYGSYAKAVGLMRNITDETNPNSWVYWANIHQRFCPHGQPYFLAWHRGYIYRFEQKIRDVSGDQGFNLPYWDYFANANLPAEFTNPANNNPLYVDRANTNVSAALGYGFTGAQLVNLPRNWPTPMEPSIESVPHNPVHNIIGGWMPSLQSPRDPIFWLHHANIDRLWCAWVAAGAGRKNPAAGDAYWNGDFVYGAQTPMNKGQTRETIATLGYRYDNERLPKPPTRRALSVPRLKAVPLNQEKLVGQTLSLGDVQGPLTLDQQSFSVRVPLGPDGRSRARQLSVARRVASMAAPPPVEINVVLDDVAVTEEGKKGGYFYKVYVNLPASGATDDSHLVGTVGPFEVAGALHHAEGGEHAGHEGGGHEGGGKARLVLPATSVLSRLPAAQLSQVTVSFIRVDGPDSPKGPAITVGDFSVQSTVGGPK